MNEKNLPWLVALNRMIMKAGKYSFNIYNWKLVISFTCLLAQQANWLDFKLHTSERPVLSAELDSKEHIFNFRRTCTQTDQQLDELSF